MGLYDDLRAMRGGTDLRTIGGTPFMPWANPYFPWDAGGPSHPSRELVGADQALALPALYAGVKILADGAASLPMRVYTKTGATTKLYTGPTLFDNPTELGTKFDWIFMAVASVILYGNAWGLIIGKDKYGFPKQIEWLPPEEVVVEQDQRSVNPMNTRVYWLGRQMKWYGPGKELVHIRGFSKPGRLEGMSLIRYFAEYIVEGQKAHRYGLGFYEAGGFPTGIFQNTQLEIDKEQADKMRAMLVATLRQHQPLVIGQDWEYTPVTTPPSEAQFIDAMQMNATQIAAILNLPPDRLGGKKGDSLTYNTTEQSTLQIVEALRPWLVRFEESFSKLLPGNRYVRFFTDALLKTDLETRMKIYQIQRMIGLRTTDEIRELEDLEPLPGGIGNEALPLDLVISMAQRAGAMPKSMMGQIELLSDHAAELLTKMQGQGLAQVPEVDPNTGKPKPPASSPQQLLGSLIASFSRAYPDYSYDELVLHLRAVGDKALALENPGTHAGALIPSVRGVVERMNLANGD